MTAVLRLRLPQHSELSMWGQSHPAGNRQCALAAFFLPTHTAASACGRQPAGEGCRGGSTPNEAREGLHSALIEGLAAGGPRPEV